MTDTEAKASEFFGSLVKTWSSAPRTQGPELPRPEVPEAEVPRPIKPTPAKQPAAKQAPTPAAKVPAKQAPTTQGPAKQAPTKPGPAKKRPDDGFDAAAIVASPSISGLTRRIEDLGLQIEFLESEVVRYRTSLEDERLRHAQQLADVSLELDHRSDVLRQSEREHTVKLHETYRKLIADRQIEAEDAITKAATAHAAEIKAERERHNDIVIEARRRAHRQLVAAQQQVADEHADRYRIEREAARSELDQSVKTITRLTAKYEAQHAELVAANALAKDHLLLINTLERRLDVVDGQHQAHLTDVERQLAIAEARITAERQRAAATVAEVLEHSASIAAEADMVRSESASLIAKAEDAAANARRQARFEYEVLAEEADERAYRASVREAELEATIAQLRAER